MVHNRREFDVAIVGGGIGGSMLACILARNDVRVLLIEGGSHPRFAIGESTVPETTVALRNLARRYDVPEIENLATHARLRKNVSPACGIKRSFSFLYHREGQEHRPRESTQFLTLAPPLGPDAHFFRQDVDAYLFNVAVSYGATAHTETFIEDLAFDAGGVTIRSRNKGEFRARYLVDAGGVRALVPQLLELRQDPPYRTRSRAIFTHMVDVPSWDSIGPAQSEHRLLSPVSESTLHHIFEGGWLWVIPFDNHSSATSELCSVGLNLDLDRYPRRPGVDPEEEFWEHVGRFPSVAAQLKSARPVRPFTANERSQFSASRVIGDRWCLLPHASDFIDPLFSSGLVVTVNALHALGHRLIDAVRENDFAIERFEYVEEWTKRAFRYYDELVSSAYISFDDFELWNAYHRIWTLGSCYGTNSILEAAVAFDRERDPAAFMQLERAPYRGIQGIDFAPFAALMDQVTDLMQGYRAGEHTRDHTIARLYELMAESELSPGSWNILDPEDHTPAGSFSIVPLLRTLAWGKFRSPAHVRGRYFNGGVKVVAKEAIEHVTADLLHGALTTKESIRDVFFTLNRDWKQRRRTRPTGSRTAALPPVWRHDPVPAPVPGPARELIAADAEEK